MSRKIIVQASRLDQAPPDTREASVRSSDHWTGLVIAISGVALFAMTFNFTITEEGLVGPRFGPRVISGLLVLGGVLLAASPWLSPRMPDEDHRSAGADDEPRSLRVLPVVLGLILVGFAYAFMTRKVGYDLSTFAAAWAVLAIFRVRSVFRITAVAAGLALAMHVLFLEVMGLFMPDGRWIDLSWIWS